MLQSHRNFSFIPFDALSTNNSQIRIRLMWLKKRHGAIAHTRKSKELRNSVIKVALEASHIMGVRHQGLADGFPPSYHHPENQYQESEVMDSPLFVSICQVFSRPL